MFARSLFDIMLFMFDKFDLTYYYNDVVYNPARSLFDIMLFMFDLSLHNII